MTLTNTNPIWSIDCSEALVDGFPRALNSREAPPPFLITNVVLIKQIRHKIIHKGGEERAIFQDT